MKEKSKVGDYVVYRPSFLSRAITLVVVSFFIMSLMLIIVRVPFSPITACWVFIVLYFMFLGYHMLLRDRLIVSPDGIEFFIQGTHGFVT